MQRHPAGRRDSPALGRRAGSPRLHGESPEPASQATGRAPEDGPPIEERGPWQRTRHRRPIGSPMARIRPLGGAGPREARRPPRPGHCAHRCTRQRWRSRHGIGRRSSTPPRRRVLSAAVFSMLCRPTATHVAVPPLAARTPLGHPAPPGSLCAAQALLGRLESALFSASDLGAEAGSRGGGEPNKQALRLIFHDPCHRWAGHGRPPCRPYREPREQTPRCTHAQGRRLVGTNSIAHTDVDSPERCGSPYATPGTWPASSVVVIFRFIIDRRGMAKVHSCSETLAKSRAGLSKRPWPTPEGQSAPTRHNSPAKELRHLCSRNIVTDLVAEGLAGRHL